MILTPQLTKTSIRKALSETINFSISYGKDKIFIDADLSVAVYGLKGDFKKLYYGSCDQANQPFYHTQNTNGESRVDHLALNTDEFPVDYFHAFLFINFNQPTRLCDLERITIDIQHSIGSSYSQISHQPAILPGWYDTNSIILSFISKVNGSWLLKNKNIPVPARHIRGTLHYIEENLI